MRKLKLNFDSDGIIADFHGMVLTYCNETFGTNYTYRDWVGYYTNHWLPEQYDAPVQKFIESREFFENLEPFPGAIEGLQLLHELGHEITITTALVGPESARGKMLWYAEWCPFLQERDLYLGSKKSYVTCDVAVDDGPDHLEKYAKNQPDCHLITIEWPYHKPEDLAYADFVAGSCFDMRSAWRNMVQEIVAVSNS